MAPLPINQRTAARSTQKRPAIHRTAGKSLGIKRTGGRNRPHIASMPAFDMSATASSAAGACEAITGSDLQEDLPTRSIRLALGP